MLRTGSCFLWVACLILAVAAMVEPLLAQTNTGTITGQILDPSKAVVPAARVSVTNLSTNVSKTVVSTSEGLYTAPLPDRSRPAVKFPSAEADRDSFDPGEWLRCLAPELPANCTYLFSQRGWLGKGPKLLARAGSAAGGPNSICFFFAYMLTCSPAFSTRALKAAPRSGCRGRAWLPMSGKDRAVE